MRLFPAAACGLALTLSLAACQRPPESAANSATNAATNTATSTAAPTAQRRAGLWEQRVSDGNTVQISRLCLDAATDTRLSLFGRQMNENQCQTHLMTRQPNGAWRISTVCDMGSGGRVTTSGLATGDFTSRYQIRFETSTVGAALEQMNGQHRLIVDAAYQGPCPAGMSPGEMELPGGRRISALDISNPAPGH